MQDPILVNSEQSSALEGLDTILIPLTAHLAPIIQEPPTMSPFLRTALIASAGLRYPIRNAFTRSELCSGSVVCPSERKYSTVTLYLSGGYPNTTT